MLTYQINTKYLKAEKRKLIFSLAGQNKKGLSFQTFTKTPVFKTLPYLLCEQLEIELKQVSVNTSYNCSRYFNNGDGSITIEGNILEDNKLFHCIIGMDVIFDALKFYRNSTFLEYKSVNKRGGDKMEDWIIYTKNTYDKYPVRHKALSYINKKISLCGWGLIVDYAVVRMPGCFMINNSSIAVERNTVQNRN